MPTMLAGTVLVVMHWVLASLAVRLHWISATVKRTRIPLICDGEVLRDGMRKASITDDDLAETLRLQLYDDDPSKVEVAYMEWNAAARSASYRKALERRPPSEPDVDERDVSMICFAFHEPKGAEMIATDVSALARHLLATQGPRAIAEAAQKAAASRAAGDEQDAKMWERVEEALREMRGPRQS